MNKTLFEMDFVAAMTKMGNLNPSTGDEREVKPEVKQASIDDRNFGRLYG